MIENNNFALAPIIKRFVKLNKADVDKKLGMSYLCNSETLYLNSAKNFVNNANELSELLNKYYDECNYIKAEEIIHRIKGYSYYIGSQFLYDYSSYLCYKIKNLDEKLLSKINKKFNNEIKLFIDYFEIVVVYKRKEIENV